MSSTVLLFAGAIVFFITVYGVVMAGGILMSRQQHRDDELPEAVTAPEVSGSAETPSAVGPILPVPAQTV